MGAGSVVQWTVKNDITASKKLIDSQKTVWEEVATGSTQWQFCTYLNPNEPQQQSERTQHHHLQGAGLSFQSDWQAGEAQRKTDIDLVSVLTQHWDSWSSHPHFIRAKTENSEAIQMALNWSFFLIFFLANSLKQYLLQRYLYNTVYSTNLTVNPWVVAMKDRKTQPLNLKSTISELINNGFLFESLLLPF